jgi:hypothetical protein
MEWWPHAVLHGLNPFHTQLLYAPEGFNLAQGALVPAAALLLAPVTAIAGPLFSFNVAMLLSPVLAAWFAFLLCRRLTGAFWPSLLGGWLFGFSSYMLGQLTSHLNLTLVFLIPAVAHLVVRALAGELSRRRFVALLALALVVQFYFSVEVFATLTIFGALTLGLAFALGDSSARARLRDLAVPIGLSYVATALVVSPYLYYALQPGGLPVLPWRTDKFSGDLLGFVVPTALTKLGGLSFTSTTNKFTAGFVEGGAYLSVPLIAAVVFSACAGWRRLEVRLMTAVLALVVLLSLGGKLHVAGAASIPLPWGLVHRLPILGQMLPARFVVYGTLLVAVLAATWLTTSRNRVAAWALALVAVASLWPAVGRGYWRSTPDIPRLFTTSAYHHAIGPRDTALVLPVGIAGQSMLWNAEAHLGFKMASGYVVAPEASDPYKHDAIDPTLTYGVEVTDQQAAAARFLASHHVTVAVLGARAATTSPWVPILEQLGWRATTLAGATLLRPAGIIPEPPQPSPPPHTPHASGPQAAQRAARRTVARYLRAFVVADATRLCSLLTPAALAAQIQRRGAGQSECAPALRPTLDRATALRKNVASASVGLAAISGSYGYVEITISRGPIEYLPIRKLGRCWLIDGIPQPASPG